MTSVRSTALLALALLPVVAVYSFYSLASQEGLLEDLTKLAEPGQSLPGTNLPVKNRYTGVEAIDGTLVSLVGFWWQILDGSAPDASVYTYHFVGQMVAIWLVIMVEGERVGNRWRAVSFIPIWGVSVQFLSYAVTLPIYAFLHLITSPTALSSRPSAGPPSSVLLAGPSKLAVIPWALAIGFGIPAYFALLPLSETVSDSFKQSVVALWQPFPLWVGLVQFVLAIFSTLIFTSKSKDGPLSHLRSLYTVAAYVGRVTHISAFTVCLTAYFFPSIFAPGIAARLNPLNAFLPLAPWSTHPRTSVGEAAMHFMHWDQGVGNAAMLLWALVLYRNAYDFSPKKFEGWFTVLRNTTASCIFEGPATSVIRLVSARDELLLGELTSEGSARGASGAKKR